MIIVIIYSHIQVNGAKFVQIGDLVVIQAMGSYCFITDTVQIDFPE